MGKLRALQIMEQLNKMFVADFRLDFKMAPPENDQSRCLRFRKSVNTYLGKRFGCLSCCSQPNNSSSDTSTSYEVFPLKPETARKRFTKRSSIDDYDYGGVYMGPPIAEYKNSNSVESGSKASDEDVWALRSQIEDEAESVNTPPEHAVGRDTKGEKADVACSPGTPSQERTESPEETLL